MHWEKIYRALLQVLCNIPKGNNVAMSVATLERMAGEGQPNILGWPPRRTQPPLALQTGSPFA